MRRSLQSIGRSVLAPIEAWTGAGFGPSNNPFYYLGALTIYFFWIVLVTGVYLYIFYRTSVDGAYASVAELTRDPLQLGGIMRSLHRYASDAAMLTMGLHVVRHFAHDRYRGFRWFSWITGVPALWLVFVLGITGYWLVWDRLAQYIAVVTTELLDQLHIFGATIAQNFLTPDGVSDRFFTLLAFLHFLSLPLLLAGFIWLHVQRLSRPVINPPRTVAVGTFVALLVLSVVHPAHSQAPADLTTAPAVLHLDWFYLAVYPLANRIPGALVWVLLFGATLLLCILPWLPRARRRPVAVVTPRWCNGCGRCVEDCPYGAITMESRPDGGPTNRKIAVVDAGRCASCGICAGACPSSTPFRRVEDLVTGIDLPDFTIQQVRSDATERLSALDTPARIMLFGCRHAVDVENLRIEGVASVSLVCSAMLPPSFIEYLLRRQYADGVMITGCFPEDCRYRLGGRWVEERVARQRVPYLRSNVPRERLRIVWAGRGEADRLSTAAKDFRDQLEEANTGTSAWHEQPAEMPEGGARDGPASAGAATKGTGTHG